MMPEEEKVEGLETTTPVPDAGITGLPPEPEEEKSEPVDPEFKEGTPVPDAEYVG